MKWHKNPSIKSTGLVVLAVAASQVIQVLLFIVISSLIQELQTPNQAFVRIMPLLPTVIASFAGGFFLGRIKPESKDRILWLVAALINAVIPISLQLIIVPESVYSLMELSVWLSFAGNSVLWLTGGFAGALSSQKKSDSNFDLALVRWTAAITALVVLLFAFTWGSFIFSRGYRLARSVELDLPPFVEEKHQPFFQPGIANIRHFQTTLKPGDTAIQDYYLQSMKADGWTNVSDRFQSWPVQEWQFREEHFNTEQIEYVIAGAHWKDISGKVAVSMVLQGIRLDETVDWNDTDWVIHGIILSRPYSEPAQGGETTE